MLYKVSKIGNYKILPMKSGKSFLKSNDANFNVISIETLFLLDLQ